MDPNEQQGNSQRPKYKRKLRNYLLDSGFQLRWTAIVVVVNIVICVALAVPLYNTVSAASDQLLAKELGEPDLTPEAMELMNEQNRKDKINTITVLAVLLALLVILSTMAWIYLTHKIAGPMYKIKKILKGVSGEKLELNIFFRKGDEFTEVLKEFRDMMKRLGDSRKKDIEILDGVIQTMGSNPSEDAVKSAVGSLKQLSEKYKSSME